MKRREPASKKTDKQLTNIVDIRVLCFTQAKDVLPLEDIGGDV